jgi:molybdate transport system ATP-binding protein
VALRVEARTRVGDVDLDVALAVAPGTCLALTGPSGAGKTTVLRIVAGLVRPAAGRVSCGDAVWLDVAGGVDRRPDARRVGYVFQDHALFPHLSAWRNVAYGLRDAPRAERRARAHALLGRFGLAARADARPATLSGGERQRVALARALARRPDVLLLDEPLASLDARTRAGASRELAAVLADVGVPALLVTHDFAEAAQLGDRVAVLDGGRVVQEGTASELASRPRSAFVAGFTGASVLTGVAAAGADGLTRVALDGGGAVVSADALDGPVAATVHPWDVTIAPGRDVSSAQNALPARVTSVVTLGTRVRVGLALPQPLAAEVTDASARALGLREGDEVVAVFKAAATRLVER